MWLNLKEKLQKWQEILISASSVTALVTGMSYTGVFHNLELFILDQFFRLRSLEPIDERIVVITIDEQDIANLKQWPISNQILAELLLKLKQQQPRAIGLNLILDSPLDAKDSQLGQIFQSTPNLITAKILDQNDLEVTAVTKEQNHLKNTNNFRQTHQQKQSANPKNNQSQIASIIDQNNQFGFINLPIDNDGKLRRNLIAIESEANSIKLSFGMRLALIYLEAEGITTQLSNGSFQNFVLGKTRFTTLKKNDGGYRNINPNYYEILLNYRGLEANFTTVSLTDVLRDKIQANLCRDRIVLIGATAESANDWFVTPYSSSLVSSSLRADGVIIQANIVSQIISAAMDGRPLLRIATKPFELTWILGWSSLTTILIWQLFRAELFKINANQKNSVFVIVFLLISGSIVGSAYLVFLAGWWLPVIKPLVAITTVTTLVTIYHSRKWQRIAIYDGLTQIANRRYFEEVLKREWYLSQKKNKPLALILCDVDYFKRYNDNYGHQTGDRCLQQVAQALQDSIRNTDLAARYGGEEFVIVLPNASQEVALQVAERINAKIQTQKIAHQYSEASNYVSLSCGVVSIVANTENLPLDLVSMADQALYQAKAKGRNCAVAYEAQLISKEKEVG